jgi:uncharacterized protein YebE (UPF0316 family)
VFLIIQSALLIFALRIIDISLYILRFMMVMRGRRILAWAFGFCQALVYIFAMSVVLTNLGNLFNMVGYAAGFATGIVVGMWVEGKLALGHLHLRIVSSRRGDEIAERLRLSGFGVTEIAAWGRDGMVNLLNCNILRKEEDHVARMVKELDEEAFITSEDIRHVERGFWG